MAETLRIEIPIETIDETAAGVNSSIQGLKKLDQAYKNTGQSAKKANDTVTAFDKRAQKTEKSLAKWAKEKYEIYLEAKEKITPVLSTIGGGLKSFAGKTWGVTLKAIDLVTAPVRGILNILKNPVFQAGAVLGISIGLADTVNTYKDFEAAMSQVQAISGATYSELGNLTDKAKEMGATTKFTATESAEAFNYMAMAGWKTNDMMDGIEGVLNLAAASGEDLGRTSDIVTDALTAFNMKASDAGHFSDVLAVAASNANTTVSGMGETFKYAGSMAGTFRYSIEDVALATGLMANAGIKGTMAGTALNSIFTRLASDTNGARSAIEDLGVEFFDANGNARDLSEVFDGLRMATAGMNDEQKSSIANTVAGMEAQKGLLAILNASEEDYNKLAEAVNNADGASQAMADTMLDNLAGSITLLQSAVDGVKISFGERLSPYIRNFADWLTGQMPAVEAGLEEFMDWLDAGVNRIQKKFDEVTNTREWQDADFLGKVGIAWDEFIAEPFSEWWSSTGKAKFAGFAQDIGAGIGTGLKVGVMAMLGIDIGETLDEGVSIGASFAKGFSEGFDFDAISGKLCKGFSNMLSSAGKLLPGGSAPDLSSIVSAYVLSRVAKPVIGMGKGAFGIGKGLFGANAATGTSLMGSFLGSAASGTGLLGKSGMLAIDLGAGNLPGGASMSAGALSATGMAAGAGAIAAGATLISGGIDAYTALKSDDREKSDAYGQSAALKMGGVAAGAAAGAAIGSVVPVLGTAVGALIGAGIGGIAGWVKGDKIKDEYEANVEEMERMAEKIETVYETTGVAVDRVSFANAGLSRALKDTEVSAEEFAAMFQESCADVMTDAFGDISLSLTEIKELAGKITFGKQAESLALLSEASQKSSDALSAFESQSRTLAKMNWKVGLGMELGEDASAYQKTIDGFVSQAKEYLESKHYESTVAMQLLIGQDDIGSLDGSLNRMYDSLQTQINIAGSKLTARLKVAVEDGIIDVDERKEIENLQAQIEEITAKVSQANENASFQALKIKYGGSGLDAESFASLQEELAIKSQEMTGSYDDALKMSITNLELQLSEGAINQDEYNEMLTQLTEGYNAQIDALQVRVESFQLDTIADAFSGELDGILPELEGTASEKLTKVMNGALALRPDVSSWSDADIIKWFGLEGLDGEMQANISQLLKQTAETIPDSAFRDMGTGNGKAMVDSAKESILAEVPSLRSAAEDAIAAACATPFDVSTAVNIRPNFSVDGAASSYLTGSSASGGTATSYAASSGLAGEAVSPKLKGRSLADTVSKNAAGGYVSGGPQLSWLAEEGYGEFIIPTAPGRRGRALELYEQAGAALGVGYHADGGYVGSPISANMDSGDDFPDDAPGNAPTGYNGSTDGSLGGTTIQVNVSMKPEFTISSDDEPEDKILSVIRKHMKEMADELGGEIAVKLEEVFSNMPLKEA